MTIIVDTSVVLKWVLQEGDSETARSLLLTETLAAPDLLMIECANVLWIKVPRGLLPRDLARGALAAISAAPVALLPTSRYVTAAQSIAFDIDQTAYDSLYLAAAWQSGRL